MFDHVKFGVRDFAASKAFGSKPGSSKWFSPADINHDYKVDLKDYFAITKTFNK